MWRFPLYERESSWNCETLFIDSEVFLRFPHHANPFYHVIVMVSVIFLSTIAMQLLWLQCCPLPPLASNYLYLSYLRLLVLRYILEFLIHQMLISFETLGRFHQPVSQPSAFLDRFQHSPQSPHTLPTYH